MSNHFFTKKKLLGLAAAAAALCVLAGFVLFHLFAQPYAFVSPPTLSQGDPLPGLSSQALHSRSAILLRRSDRAVLFEKNAGEQMTPASLVKLMTVVTAIKKQPDLQKKRAISPSTLQSLRAVGASVAYSASPSAEFSIADLLYGAVVASGADCCLTIALELCGTEQAFVEEMNRNAQQLHMTQTQFADCTGLSDQNKSSARDIALLLEYALHADLFRELFTAQDHTTAPLPSYPGGLLIHSRFFSLFDGEELAGCELLGGKTGFTDEAGLCLAGLGRTGGQEYIWVTLGAAEEDAVSPQVEDAQTIWAQLAAQG